LTSILNNIRVNLAYLLGTTGAEHLSLRGASFGGGICGYYAAKRPDELTRLVLLNPQLDYKKRTIDTRPYRTNNIINNEAARELNETGAIVFTPTLRHGRPRRSFSWPGTGREPGNRQPGWGSPSSVVPTRAIGAPDAGCEDAHVGSDTWR
jgi:pimeloyl-ACP methyl ester carboxylesterase